MEEKKETANDNSSNLKLVQQGAEAVMICLFYFIIYFILLFIL